MSRSTSKTTTTEIIIPYKPRPVQEQIHQALETHRFCVLVTHRQLGKTVCAVNHLLKSALQNQLPSARYFYIAPFLKQVKLIAWDYIKRFASALPQVKFNEAELCVQLPTGAKIWLLGADNPDALRGTYADGVVLDEYAQIKPDVFNEIIRPMLLSRKGWILFCGTPKGQNHFYELYNRASVLAQQTDSGWWCGVFRADETGLISPEELQEISAHTPSHLYRQEYLCDFTADTEDILIPVDLVSQACARQYSSQEIACAPKIIGVDPARFGADRSVIFKRQGLQSFPPQIFEKIDQMTLAAQVALQIQSFRPDAVFIDAGCGGGVIDRLRQLGFRVMEVAFGAAPMKAGQYANKRAEMWSDMKQWLQAGGALPPQADLKADLCALRYDFDAVGRMRLESKETLKARVGKSPDLADALALTFAYPVCKQNTLVSFGKTEYEVL